MTTDLAISKFAKLMRAGGRTNSIQAPPTQTWMQPEEGPQRQSDAAIRASERGTQAYSLRARRSGCAVDVVIPGFMLSRVSAAASYLRAICVRSSPHRRTETDSATNTIPWSAEFGARTCTVRDMFGPGCTSEPIPEDSVAT
jgi:hypothetical protein